MRKLLVSQVAMTVHSKIRKNKYAGLKILLELTLFFIKLSKTKMNKSFNQIYTLVHKFGIFLVFIIKH